MAPLSETFFSVCDRTTGLSLLINRNKEKIACLKSFLLGSRRLLESELPLQGLKKTVITGLRKKIIM
jgi:hypothetical protein